MTELTAIERDARRRSTAWSWRRLDERSEGARSARCSAVEARLASMHAAVDTVDRDQQPAIIAELTARVTADAETRRVDIRVLVGAAAGGGRRACAGRGWWRRGRAGAAQPSPFGHRFGPTLWSRKRLDRWPRRWGRFWTPAEAEPGGAGRRVARPRSRADQRGLVGLTLHCGVLAL